MPKVEINSQGVSIHIEANEASPTELSAIALKLYKDATDIDTAKSAGPALGFTTDRSGDNS
mgnify:CR=1 FL=1